MHSSVKHITAISFLALMLMKMLGMPLVCVNFNANKEYIAKVLCINREKPQMECNGQCHLKKQLSAANESSESSDEKGNTKTAAIDFYEEFENYNFLPQVRYINSFRFIKADNYLSDFSSAIFHPPCYTA